jgi:DNA primase catalytic subunit
MVSFAVQIVFGITAHPVVPTKLFTHREFAFTLAGDVYLRYNSFANADDFKREVLRLNPSRFEIGPQYTARVSFAISNMVWVRAHGVAEG